MIAKIDAIAFGFFVELTRVLYFLFLSSFMSLRFVVGPIEIPIK